jgi:hypothetical protein
MDGKLVCNGEVIASPVSVTVRNRPVKSGAWGGILMLPLHHSFDAHAHQVCTLVLSGGRQGEITCTKCEEQRVTFVGNGPLRHSA